MKRVLSQLLFLLCLYVYPQKYGLTSPDGKLTAGIEIDNGIYVALLKGRNPLIRFGNIAVENYYVAERNADFKVLKAYTRSVNEIIEPEIREKSSVYTNSYNELEVRFRKNYAITFRMFNEGLAYRFSMSERTA